MQAVRHKKMIVQPRGLGWPSLQRSDEPPLMVVGWLVSKQI
jgi:hypothetical protein